MLCVKDLKNCVLKLFSISVKQALSLSLRRHVYLFNFRWCFYYLSGKKNWRFGLVFEFFMISDCCCHLWTLEFRVWTIQKMLLLSKVVKYLTYFTWLLRLLSTCTLGYHRKINYKWFVRSEREKKFTTVM